MKRLMHSCWVSLVFILSAVSILDAQTTVVKSLPQVPITYPGDTDQTIIRRVQWIKDAKKEKVLSWWGTASPGNAKALIVAFNKIYPFIRVDYWNARGEEIRAKIEGEFASGRVTADITMGGDLPNLTRWRQMGMIDKLSDIILGIEKMDKRMFSKYGDWAQPGHTVLTPQYNTKLVSAAEAPKNWEDLLNPMWKGQIGLTTDMKCWTVLALAEGGWGIEKTEKFLTQLKAQDLRWIEGHTGGHALLIAGEYKIFAEDYNYHVPVSQKKGAPVEWVRVNPIVVVGPAFALQNRAPHPKAARLFLEWLFSSEGLLAYDNATFQGAAFPGMPTRVSKMVEGLNFVHASEEYSLQELKLGLGKKFAELLGITPK